MYVTGLTAGRFPVSMLWLIYFNLQLNVKSFIIAVLLSAKLAAYKGTVPRDHVVVCLGVV